MDSCDCWLVIEVAYENYQQFSVSWNFTIWRDSRDLYINLIYKCLCLILGRADQCAGEHASRLWYSADQAFHRHQKRSAGQERQKEEQVRYVGAVVIC